MALNKYIAVKICGNPDSNSGFTPIILFNSASFTIEDQSYVGFDNCSYFYTIKTTSTQTIYKLIKNNVRSYGAFRPGSLIIAFSIPRNYGLENGYTPYDVLTKLKNEFLRRCMTCKDTVRETYEFNSGRIDPNILNDVAQEFSITPKLCPVRIMNPNAPKGYVVKTESEIIKLFHDTNYHEFDNFSEIIIADSVTQTNYIPINNIQIPRRIDYSIYVDGIYKMSCNDINGQLTASSNKPKEYYDNRQVHFTIQELKDGNYFEGIELDELNERINISTLNWATPKSEKFWIRIYPPKGFDKALINRNLIIVKGSFGDIRLDNDLSFTLKGEHIAEISSVGYFLADGLNSRYKISSHKLNGDIVSIVIDVIRISANDNRQREEIHPVQQNHSPIVDIRIVIEDYSLKQIKKNSHIKAKLKASTKNGEETICSQVLSFHGTKPNRTYEGHFYVPKNNYVGYVEFSIEDKVWKSQKKIEPIVDTLTLEQKDFKIEQKDFVKRNISLVKTFAFSLLTLLFFALGYAVHDPIQSLFAKPEQATNNTDTVTVVTDEHISEEDAEEILKKAEERLKAKDIKFEEITDFYQKFNDDSVTLMAQDKQNFDNKICNRIKDYYTISQYIINGDFDSIKSFIQYPKQPHIWDTHKQIISKIIESDDTRSKFMNRYSNLKSFVDIDELFKSLPPSNEREEKPKVKQIKSDTKQEEKINGTETPNKQLKER